MIDAKQHLAQHDANELKKLLTHDRCDICDYLIAVGCGAVGGLLDIFFVGSPVDSVLGPWTDAQVDKAVLTFARLYKAKDGKQWSPSVQNENNVKSAIGFLERNSKINYDQRKPEDVGNAFNLAPNTHHMMSLAHSPDIIGLFFSLLNQFTSTSSFFADGQLIMVHTNQFTLQGGNFLAKLYCGVANWFVHLVSDIAGSSGAHGRGTGIVMPFYELFGACEFGSFEVNGTKKTLAELARSVFVQGYDARFALTMSMPVLISDLLIKLCWALRRYFGFKKPLKDCIPSLQHPDLRMMLIVGTGTLCLMDGVDAAIRSGGNWVAFFLRINFVAWCRLLMLVVKEISVRADLFGIQVEAFVCVNAAIEEYLAELEKIDIAQYKSECALYAETMKRIALATNEADLNRILCMEYVARGIELPWKGEFEDFMMDKDAFLEFK